MSSDASQSPLFAEVKGQQERREAPTFGESLLALNDIKGLGIKGLRAFVSVFKDNLSEVWTTRSEELKRHLERAKIPSSDKIVEEIERGALVHLIKGKQDVRELALKRRAILQPSEIPERFKDVLDPPLWLFVEGDAHALYERPAVAVVGTRRSTFLGREAAALVSEILAPYPITLVSGLAEGIDEEAHRSSLREGVRNVAFLGTGIDEVFPASTAGLRYRINREGGAVVTEYLPNAKRRQNKANFVERNRLQAALADVVVPVEAKPRGGTAHTVQFAKELGRRIVGVRWKGANGMVSELEKAGYPIVDIFEPSGRRALDKMFRELAEKEGHETSALASVTRRLHREAKYRELRSADLEELRRELDVFADGD